MIVLPTSLLLVLAERAEAQNVQAFAGAQLVVRSGPDVGIGLIGRLAGMPAATGPELGVWADARGFLRSGLELGAGGIAGIARADYTDGPGYLPVAAANVKIGPTISTRWGPSLRVGVEARALVGGAGLEVYHLYRKRDEVEHAWALPSVSLGLEAPLVEAYTVGRPLRVAGGWLLPRSLGGLRGAARRWYDQARGELASVAAFTRLARELVALAAPRSLVRAAERAAADEARHAEGCLQLACRAAGRRLRLGPTPPAPARRPSRRAVAEEAWVDGVRGEARAALEAAIEADTTPARHTARVLATIAREEARHARLGADLWDWASDARGRLPA